MNNTYHLFNLESILSQDHKEAQCCLAGLLIVKFSLFQCTFNQSIYFQCIDIDTLIDTLIDTFNQSMYRSMYQYQSMYFQSINVLSINQCTFSYAVHYSLYVGRLRFEELLFVL